MRVNNLVMPEEFFDEHGNSTTPRSGDSLLYHPNSNSFRISRGWNLRCHFSSGSPPDSESWVACGSAENPDTVAYLIANHLGLGVRNAGVTNSGYLRWEFKKKG